MAGLASLLGSTSGAGATADQTNSDAMTATNDSQANQTSDNANKSSDEPTRTTNDGSDENLAGNNPAPTVDPTGGLFDVGDDTGDREPVLIATSAPIQRFKIGRFQFDRAVLNLFDQDDADEFRSLVSKLPPVDRNQIKIIDRSAAEALVRPIEPGATKQFDSSVGRQQDRVGGASAVGTEALDADVGGQGERFAKVAQMDNNAPVAGTEPKNVVNEANQGDVDTANKQ